MLLSTMLGRGPYKSTRQLMEQKGNCSRRDAIGAMFEGIDTLITSTLMPGIALSKRPELLTQSILALEQENRKYLGIPDLNFKELARFSKRVAQEMAFKGRSGYEIENIVRDEDRETVVKLNFETYDLVLSKYFQKGIQGHDQRYLSVGINEGKLDCDLLSCFYPDAGALSGNPVYFVPMPGHALVRYHDKNLKINYETMLGKGAVAESDYLLLDIYASRDSKEQLLALGLDPDKGYWENVKVAQFPSDEFLIGLNNYENPDERITPESQHNGNILNSLDYAETMAHAKAKLSIHMHHFFGELSEKPREYLMKARRLTDEAAKESPRDPLVYEALALCDFCEGDYRGALRNYENALMRHPGSQNFKTGIKLMRQCVLKCE